MASLPKGADGMNNWISVNDRMPNRRGTYLTFCRFRDGQTEIKVKLWTPTIGFTSQAKAVTHWMPLPDAPEEGK